MNELHGTQEVDPKRRVIRAAVLLATVTAVGTFGFMIVEPSWSFWKSLYFTLITLTTVGYSDEGLSPEGRGFTTIVLVGGIATAAYAAGQLLQGAIAYQLDWRRRMQCDIEHLRDHFIVCGIGRVGRAVCERLAESSLPFVVIEQNKEQFRWARSHGYLAIEGRASEDEILTQAGVDRARGIVCAVDSDSENIVITLSARELNPDIMIVSRADDLGAVHKIKRAGASRVVSPALRGGGDIANVLMNPNLADFVEQSYGADGEFRLAEVSIDANSPLVGQTIREYGSREPSLVFVAVKRPNGSTAVRPPASECLDAGEVVIVVGPPDAVTRMGAAGRVVRAAS